jgi:WD40 repeat protein/serine/threonine protein kinase
MNPDILCLTASDLAEFLEGQMEGEEEASVLAHLDRCDACRLRLESAAADPQEWSALAASLQNMSFDEGPGARALSPDSQSHDIELCDPAFDVVTYLAPTDDPHMLGRLGVYEIVGVVGRGGMGVVLKGFDRALNRYVAIKILAPTLASNAAARQRFAREARASAAVVHEHVIAIHSVSEHRGLPYLVMPYLSGPSLARRIKRDGALGVLEVLRISRQVALGLAAAHEQGLVHRDVKPANILLESGIERVTITDFGLARAIDDVTITQPGVIAGTPQFMSPEQSRGEAVDLRSDLFSLGSVMYGMCTGTPPFRGDVTMSVLRRICDEEPTPIRELNSQVPEWLCEIVEKLHRKSPSDRFQSAGELATLLDAWLVHLQQPAHNPEPRRLQARRQRRSPFARFVRPGIVASVALMLFVLSWWVIQRLASLPQPKEVGEVRSKMAELIFQRVPVSIPPDTQNVRSLSFSRDGNLLAVAHGNQISLDSPGPGSMQVWNVTERKLLAAVAERRGVNSISLTPDGRRVAYGTFEGIVKVVELPQAKEVHRTTADAGAPVAFSRDGTLLAIATHPHKVELWDMETWTRRQIDLAGDLRPGVLLSVAFSPDGSMVAVGGGTFPPNTISGQAAAWDITSGKRIATLSANAAIMHVEFSSDGQQLATACLDTKATLWDLHSGQPVRSYCDPESGLVCVRFLEDEKCLATLGPRSGVKLFKADRETPHAQMKFDDHLLEAMSVSADGRMIASGGTDRLVRLWDPKTNKNFAILGPESDTDVPLAPIRVVAASTDERWIALGLDNGAIVIRDAQGSFVRALTGHEGKVSALAFSWDGQTVISAGEDRTIRSWNVGTEGPGGTIGHCESPVITLAVSPGGYRVAAGSYEDAVYLFDISEQKLIGNWSAHDGQVSALAFSSSGTHLLTAGRDGVAKVWSADSLELLVSCDGLTRPICAATLSPDAETIATGSDDGRIFLFSARTGRNRRVLFGHEGEVLTLAFAGDGATLVSGGEDRIVRVWDVTTLGQRQVLAGHTGAVTSLAFLPKSGRILSASVDRTLKVWSPDAR